MNRKELSQNHWKYYLMLEKRFVESIEFVELHEDNFDAILMHFERICPLNSSHRGRVGIQ